MSNQNQNQTPPAATTPATTPATTGTTVVDINANVAVLSALTAAEARLEAATKAAADRYSAAINALGAEADRNAIDVRGDIAGGFKAVGEHLHRVEGHLIAATNSAASGLHAAMAEEAAKPRRLSWPARIAIALTAAGVAATGIVAIAGNRKLKTMQRDGIAVANWPAPVPPVAP